MKANVLLPGAAALALLSACAPRAAAPVAAPPPQPAATPAAPAPLPPLADWRDAPQTPGAWRWAAPGGRSTASFGVGAQAPLLTLTCAAPGSVRLIHSAVSERTLPVGITTSAGTFPLFSDAAPAGSTSAAVTVTLPARAPVLDAMAFSRGRFAVEVAGQAPLFLPAWPEVSRVIEDCR